MPQSRFISCIGFLFALAAAANAQEASWVACEKAKLRELQLQRDADERKPAKRKSSRRDGNRHQRAEEIETWLWKNCREYSYELRQLEQERM